jgi:DNA-binding response OmpR family regulator
MNKILLVEDDQILARLYQAKFKKEGFEIELAYDGLEGVDKMKAFAPDLVILDLIMPKMDGFSFLEKIQDDSSLNPEKAPILVLSNLGQESDIKRAQELGAKDFFVKADISLSQMIEKVKKHLK